MAQDALISLMPLRWQDGRIVKDYDADENWGGLGDGDPGRIGPVVAAGAALMVIASIAYSLAGNNSSVNNSDENNKDYIEINFTNDNGTTTVIRINSNNFTNSPSMVIGRG